MRKRLLILTALVCISPLVCLAKSIDKDSLQVKNRVFFSSFYNNPALKRYLNIPSSWEINSGYSYDNSPDLLQKGSKLENYQFNTHTFKLGYEDLYYGNLSFNTGQRDDVLWNESSDYDFIYPFVLADKVGGNMKYEEYLFNGAFVKRVNTLEFGLDASYRALYEYRTVDPRPSNTVSEYKILAGISQVISSRYVLGVSGSFSVYNQSNRVKVFKEDGSQRFYFFRGGGHFDGDFSRTNREISTYYDIFRFGFSAQLIPKKKRGLFLQVAYRDSEMQLDINEFNDVNIASLETKEICFDMSYAFAHYKTMLTLSYKKRKGFEKIYNQVSYNNYQYLTTYNKYNKTDYSIENSHCISSERSSCEIKLRYDSQKLSYKPDFNQDVCNLTSSFTYAYVTHSIDFNLSLSYRKNLKSELLLATENQVKGINEELIQPNHKYLSDDVLSMLFETEYRYAVKNNLLAFTRLTYQRFKYKTIGDGDMINLSLGFRF